MIKIILITLVAILTSLAIIYSWYNRDSNRIILSLLAAISIGFLGFITKELITNKKEKFSNVIPVAVFYGLPEYKPLNIELPYLTELSMCMQEMKKEDLPNNNKGVVDIMFGQSKYFDAIQYIIVKAIFKKFSKSWNTKEQRIPAPQGEAFTTSFMDEDGIVITIGDFFKKMPNNYFVKLQLYKDIPEAFGGKAMFPPNTKISIETNDFISLISFNTKYISLNLKISRSTSSIGIGEYSKLLGLTSAPGSVSTTRFGNSMYLIEINAEQNAWFNGHPEMKKHRSWADSIAKQLDNDFNFESIRENHRKKFLLYGSSAINDI